MPILFNKDTTLCGNIDIFSLSISYVDLNILSRLSSLYYDSVIIWGGIR